MGVAVAVGGTGVGVAVGGTGVGMGVAVGGTSVGVAVGGTGVGMGVAVGGTGVGVAVGGTGVDVGVGGTRVGVGVGVGNPTKTRLKSSLKLPGSNRSVVSDLMPFRKNSTGCPVASRPIGLTTRLLYVSPSITAEFDWYWPTLATNVALAGTEPPSIMSEPPYTAGCATTGVGVGVGSGKAGNVRSKSDFSVSDPPTQISVSSAWTLPRWKVIVLSL